MHRKSPSKIWRKSKKVYRLMGSKSLTNGKEFYPPVGFDPHDNNSKFEPVEMPSKAKLVSWSIARVAPSGFEDLTPYAVGILEFENGERVTGQIVDIDFDSLKKNQIFYPIFRKMFTDGHDGIIHYGVKWTR